MHVKRRQPYFDLFIEENVSNLLQLRDRLTIKALLIYLLFATKDFRKKRMVMLRDGKENAPNFRHLYKLLLLYWYSKRIHLYGENCNIFVLRENDIHLKRVIRSARETLLSLGLQSTFDIIGLEVSQISTALGVQGPFRNSHVTVVSNSY